MLFIQRTRGDKYQKKKDQSLTYIYIIKKSKKTHSINCKTPFKRTTQDRYRTFLLNNFKTWFGMNATNLLIAARNKIIMARLEPEKKQLTCPIAYSLNKGSWSITECMQLFITTLCICSLNLIILKKEKTFNEILQWASCDFYSNPKFVRTHLRCTALKMPYRIQKKCK